MFLFSKLVQDITILIKFFTFTIRYEFTIMSLEFLSANSFLTARTTIFIFILIYTHLSCQFFTSKFSPCFSTLYLAKWCRNIDKLVSNFEGWYMVFISCTSSLHFFVNIFVDFLNFEFSVSYFFSCFSIGRKNKSLL